MADFVTVRIPQDKWDYYAASQSDENAVEALGHCDLVDVATPECVRRWQLLDYADQRAAIDCLDIDELRVETAADCLEMLITTPPPTLAAEDATTIGVDKAFYELTVAQRDQAWRELEDAIPFADMLPLLRAVDECQWPHAMRMLTALLAKLTEERRREVENDS